MTFKAGLTSIIQMPDNFVGTECGEVCRGKGVQLSREWNEFIWLIAQNAAKGAERRLRLSVDCNSIHFIAQIPYLSTAYLIATSSKHKQIEKDEYLFRIQWSNTHDFNQPTFGE